MSTQTKLPASLKTPTNKHKRKHSLEECEEMSQEELIAALQERDTQIAQLQSECKRLKKATVTPTSSSPAPVLLSPDQLQAQAGKLRKLIYKGIKSQMKWKPSCKFGKARFSYEGICDETTFRTLMSLKGKEKTKGKRMEVDEFQDVVLQGLPLYASVRYDTLRLKGNVNVSYSQKENTIKITGGYGL